MSQSRLAMAAAGSVVLASLGLGTTMDDYQWLLPTLVLVAVVAGACTAARRFAFPSPLVPLTGLVALCLAMTVLFTSGVAVLAFIPGPAAVGAFNELLLEAGDTIRRSAPPAPTTDGLVALVAVCIALVALLVDTIAVTWRSAATAGLPLLALYIAPAAILDESLSVVYFLLASTGFLFLLLVDGRIRLGAWGRVLGRRTARPGARPDITDNESLGLVGRRIGAAALGAAVVVPLVVPVGSGLINLGSGGNGDGGDGRIVQTVNPYVSLQRNLNRPVDEVILTYTTDDPTPDYLRMVTLDTFDGVLWQPAELQTSREQRVRDGIPTAPGLAPEIPRDERLSAFAVGQQLEDNRLPLPYPATEVEIDGDWRYDEATRNVLSTDDSTTSEAEYDVTYLDLEITGDALARSTTSVEFADERYTQLPELAPVVSETARLVTQTASTPYARAVLLQDWFRNEFEYDDQTVRETEAPLVDFLDVRSGYCQQFASTMAVMARQLGIPARVNVGFTPGSRADNDVWSVRWSDTHAWPELFFVGVGWVRFEPTPRAGGGVATPDYAQISGGGGAAAPGAPGTPGAELAPTEGRAGLTALDRQQAAEAAAEQQRLAAAATAAADAAARATDNQTRRWVLVVVGFLLVVAAIPVTIRTIRRRRRFAVADGGGIDGVTAVWAELRDSYRDVGQVWPESLTPRVLARTVSSDAHLATDDHDALQRLAFARERAEYASSLGPIGDLRRDGERVCSALIAAAPTWQRRRARIFPGSTMQAIGDAWGRTAGGLFDRLDDATRWMRRRLSWSR